MGADFISVAYTVENDTFYKCTVEQVGAFLTDDVIAAVVEASPALRETLENQYDGEETAEDIRALLLEGADAAFNSDRAHSSFSLGDGLSLRIAGGMSWGDDPYDGYGSEVAFADTCLDYPLLGRLVGIVAAVPTAEFFRGREPVPKV